MNSIRIALVGITLLLTFGHICPSKKEEIPLFTVRDKIFEWENRAQELKRSVSDSGTIFKNYREQKKTEIRKERNTLKRSSSTSSVKKIKKNVEGRRLRRRRTLSSLGNYDFLDECKNGNDSEKKE